MTTTTKFWTWTDIWAKISDEFDLEDETFVDAAEALGYANEAIDEAESEVMAAYQDYFLSKASLTFVLASSEAALPTTIYAHKIRRIMYINGTQRYVIKRMRDWKKFEEYTDSQASDSTNAELRYFIINDTAGSPKILLSRPATATDVAATKTCFFIRQANRLASGSDVCDIPESVAFVFDFMRERIEFKRAAMSPRHQASLMKLNGSPETGVEGSRQRLVSTLAEMIPDGDNDIEPDTSAYDDMN